MKGRSPQAETCLLSFLDDDEKDFLFPATHGGCPHDAGANG